MLEQVLHAAFIYFCFTVPAWLLFRILKIVYSAQPGYEVALKKEILLFVFFVYISSVLLLTVVPLPETNYKNYESERINLVPVMRTFNEFMLTLTPAESYRFRPAMENIIGNFLLFFPAGILLPMLFKKADSLKRLAWIFFLSSFLIELMQFLLRLVGNYRFVDIDDIIMNVTGGLLGFFMYKKLLQNF
jgi:glycopeptide antibiotics resistance protein